MVIRRSNDLGPRSTVHLRFPVPVKTLLAEVSQATGRSITEIASRAIFEKLSADFPKLAAEVASHPELAAPP